MASDYQYQRPRFDTGLLRDLIAVALMIAGATGLAWATFAYDWRLGLATVSVMAIGAGAFLGYDR